MSSFIPHIDLLPENQQRLWPQLAPVTSLGFVLYGGTAIGLQLGHRHVRHFDFFTERTFDAEDIFKHLPFLQEYMDDQEGPNWLRVHLPGMIRLTFTGKVAFGRVGTPVVCDNGVQLASLEDMMALRLRTLLDRSVLSDYRDIVAMLCQGVSVSEGLGNAVAMFGVDFPPMKALKALLLYEETGQDAELSAAERRVLTEAAYSVGLIPEGKLLTRTLQA